MGNRKFGYARVSSKEQNLDRQIIALKEYVPEENIITDKQSGKNLERPGYQALKGPMGLREGDVLYITSLERLSRNKKDIKAELQWFKDKGIDLSSYPKLPYDNPLAERAVLYSTPGGLMRTAERFVPGISAKTRKIEGQPGVFEYLSGLNRLISSGNQPYYQLVDCLNCEKGCNRGGGTVNICKNT